MAITFYFYQLQLLTTVLLCNLPAYIYLHHCVWSRNKPHTQQWQQGVREGERERHAWTGWEQNLMTWPSVPCTSITGTPTGMLISSTPGITAGHIYSHTRRMSLYARSTKAENWERERERERDGLWKMQLEKIWDLKSSQIFGGGLHTSTEGPAHALVFRRWSSKAAPIEDPTQTSGLKSTWDVTWHCGIVNGMHN